jgi:hypothetical protein
VYLELIKPVVGYQSTTANETDELEILKKRERKRYAQATLYTVLEQYLR